MSPCRALQRLAAGAAPVAWALPFAVVETCNQTHVTTGWELAEDFPTLWLPAIVLPALWWLIGARGPAAEALRLPVSGAGFLLGALFPLFLAFGGVDLLTGGVLSVVAWTALAATDAGYGGAGWWRTRTEPARRWWLPPIARAPHLVWLGAWLGATDNDEVWLLLPIFWVLVAAPQSIGLAVLARTWPAPGGRALLWGNLTLLGVVAVGVLAIPAFHPVRHLLVLLVMPLDLAWAHLRSQARP